MSWRGSDRARDEARRTNRERLGDLLRADAYAPGLIAYIGDEPAGWLGFGPRRAMPRLVKGRTIPALDDKPVWSIGCFRIRAGYRRRGVARALLRAAVEHVRAVGAPGIEAYPIDAEGQRIDVAFGFTGFTSMFEAEGFRRAMLTDGHSAGRPRWLMRLDFD
jgi:GNAT superfamily N-acetyltransferase